MLALSVQEPWATMIIHHGKSTENRTWRTSYFGRLVICASKTIDLGKEYPQKDWAYLCDHYASIAPTLPEHYGDLNMMPGYAIGIVEVTAYDRDRRTLWDESDQWHWRFANPIPFAHPFPVRGQLGLFNVPTTAVYQAVAEARRNDLFPNWHPHT